MDAPHHRADDARVERRRLESSLIRSVGFDREQNILELELAGGRTYRYFGVPARIHRALLAAPSAGAFFNREIRERYPFVEL